MSDDDNESDSDVPLGATNGAVAAAAKRAANGDAKSTNGNGKRARSPSASQDPASNPVVSKWHFPSLSSGLLSLDY